MDRDTPVEKRLARVEEILNDVRYFKYFDVKI